MSQIFKNIGKIQARRFYDSFEGFRFSLNSSQSPKDENIKNIKTVASIQNKSRELLKDLNRSKSAKVSLIHLEHLVDYLKLHPVARQQVFKEKGIPHILQLRNSTKDEEILKQTRLALTLLGYVDPVKGRGVRILALDGGGTRGVMMIEMLKKISELCQQPIHELFDLIVGTSTGAIVAFLIGIQKMPLSKCDSFYEKLSSDIFEANKIVGTGKLFLNHAYYSTSNLENILKKVVGSESLMIGTAAFTGPKVASVATLVNHHVLQAYVFRNYCFKADSNNIYVGSSKHKLWEAIRASTAAPGYFEEFRLDGDIFQDGGLLTNNPCALALHEASTLWPTTPIQTVVSIGSGMYHGGTGLHTEHFTTLTAKLKKLVASATDVEAIHTIVQDLLPQSNYIRLNPNMSIDVQLDESRSDILNQLKQDTHNYMDKFSHKFDAAAKALLLQKTIYEKCKDKVELKFACKGWL